MALVLNDNTLAGELDAAMAHIQALVLYCRLFTNNVTPAHSQAPGAFTEAAWTGYSAQAIGGTWSSSVVTSSIAQSFLNVPPVFTNGSGSPVTVYGYFVTDVSKTLVYWAELDPSAPVTLNPGDSYSPLLQRTYKSQF